MNRLYLILIFVIITSFATILCRTFLIPATDTSARHNIRGDGYSDINTISAIHYFVDHGFWKSKLRPVHHYNNPERPQQFYTHYPALPDVVSAFIPWLFQSKSEVLARIPMIILSLFLLFLNYKGLSLFCFSKKERLTNLILLIPTCHFVFFADSLHKHLHEYLIQWISILFLFRFYNTDNKTIKKLLYLSSPFIAFWATHSSFEAIVIFVCLVAGFSFVYNKNWWLKIFAPINVLLAFSVIFGLFIHVYLNSLVLGGWENTFNDLSKAFFFRTIGDSRHSVEYPQIFFLNLYYFIQRQERYFLIPGIMLIYFFWLKYKNLKSLDETKSKLLLVIAFSAFAWGWIMPQHADIHHFTAKHFFVCVGIISAYGLKLISEKTKLSYLNFKNSKTLKTISKFSFLVFIWIYIIGMALTQNILLVFWKYSWRYLFI